MVNDQVSQEICAERYMMNIFIYFILFNFHEKTHRIVVTLLLSRKHRVTGVRQIAQSYTHNGLHIAYIFSCPGHCFFYCTTAAPLSKEEALPVD